MSDRVTGNSSVIKAFRPLFFKSGIFQERKGKGNTPVQYVMTGRVSYPFFYFVFELKYCIVIYLIEE